MGKHALCRITPLNNNDVHTSMGVMEISLNWRIHYMHTLDIIRTLIIIIYRSAKIL